MIRNAVIEITVAAFESIKHHPIIQITSACVIGFAMALMDWYGIEYEIQLPKEESA